MPRATPSQFAGSHRGSSTGPDLAWSSRQQQHQQQQQQQQQQRGDEYRASSSTPLPPSQQPSLQRPSSASSSSAFPPSGPSQDSRESMYGHSYSQEPEMSQQSGAIYATGIPVATRNRGYSAGSAAARRPSAAATGQGSEGTDDEGDAAQAAGPNMRRVAHSAVEKRRRERIKDKIEVLRNLVPTCAMRPNLHKLNVLEHTIDYIYFMRKLVHKTMGERDRATYSAQQQQQQQQQQRPGGPPPHHSQAPPGAPHPRMYQQQPIQSPHPQQHHPHAAIPSQDAAHMYGMHHPPHSHHPAHVPPPHAPVPHDPHYMQFDIDLDNVNMQLLCPPPPPEHGGPAPVAASPTPHIAVPVARHAHPAASRRPAPYTVPAASPAHAPPPPTTPSVVAAAPRRALTVSPVLSAPGSVPTTTASPMRVDNLLC